MLSPTDYLSEHPVGIMLKVPEVGRVKTRLGETIGMKNAAEFYAVSVGWLLERFRVHGRDFVLFFAPKEREKRLRALYSIPDGCPVVAQQGNDLGERIHHALTWLEEHGSTVPCVIGTDSPDLPMDWISEAMDLLKEDEELVLGPARDGGYYLVGCSPVRKHYFHQIDWSTDVVLEQTRARAEEVGVKPAFLPQWRDIDTWEDLKTKIG